jgi:hypothetical protein
MRTDERLKLPDELGVATEVEVCLDPQLERGKAKLFEAEDLNLRERLAREVGESRPAPEAERFAEQRGSSIGRGLSRLLDELLEAKEVELVRAHANQIARLLRHDRFARGKHLA